MTALALGPVTNVNTGETFGTIQAAIDDADTLTGDTILVFSGTYNERVVVTKSVGIKGEDAYTVLSGPPGSNVGFEIQASYVNLSHFTINRNSGDAGNVINVAGDHCNISQVAIDGDGGSLVRGISVNNNDDYTTIMACTLTNMGTGIFIGGSPMPRHNDVAHNVITGCTHGVWLSYAYGTRIWANEIQSGYYGIQAEFSEDGLIYSNAIDGQATAGLYLYNSYNNLVIKNRVSGSAAGIYVALTPPATPNTIYFNYFTSNTDNCVYVPDPSADTFSGVASYSYAANNHISQSLGNYWSDYSGTDGNGDGIGDTPYANDAMADNYPLISDTIIAIPDAPPVLNVDTGETFWTIQDAIADAETLAGHVIEAGSGTYYGIVNIDKAGLTVRGKDTGSGRPVMDALTPGTGATGFLLNADDVVLEGFDVFQAPDWPAGANLVEVNGDDCTVSGMYIDGMGSWDSYYNYGIVVNGDRATITRNKVSQCREGIWIKGSDNIVYYNTADFNGINNILVGPGSSGNIIDINAVNVAGGNAGIAVQHGSGGNRISGNVATGNKQAGIQLWGADDNFLFGNSIWCNGLGIEVTTTMSFEYSTGNRIQNNYVRHNDYNVYVLSGNSGNYFWLNDFSDARLASVYSDEPGNTWNSPWPYIYTSWTDSHEYQSLLGNKWRSDYTGSDADGDAIGDTPYAPGPNIIDNFPVTTEVDVWEVYLGAPDSVYTGGNTYTCRGSIFKNYVSYTGADVDLTLSSGDAALLSFPGGAGSLTQTIDTGGNVMTTLTTGDMPGTVQLTASVFGFQAYLIDGLGGIIGDSRWVAVDGPMGWKFRSGLSNSGIYDDGGIQPGNSMIWSFTSDNEVYSSPAVVNGVVYVGSSDNKVYALDAVTGAKVWEFESGNTVFSSPAVAGGIVYVGSDDGKVYALDAVTGAWVWEFDTGFFVQSSPAVAGGLVYVGSSDNKVYALDAVTGAKVWEYATFSTVSSSPAVAGGLVYVGSWDGNLYALDAVTGAWVWVFGTGSAVVSSPAVINGVLYVGRDDNKVYALDAVTGLEVWEFETGAAVRSSPAAINGVVYVGCDDGKVYALDAVTGAKVWEFATGAAVFSSPAVAGGVVYVGSDDGKVYALDAVTGAKVWEFATGAAVYSSPVVANGLVYVGSVDGNVYALGNIVPPVADFTGTSTMGVAPLRPLFLDASTGNPTSWDWDFGDGTPHGTEQNPQHWYMNPGVYTVTLTVNNAAGSDTMVQTGYVEVLPGRIFGDSGGEDGYAVKAVSDGYILVGDTSSFGVVGKDVYLAKTDFSGRLIWENHYDNLAFDSGHDVVEVSDGYVIVATTSAGSPTYKVWLLKAGFDGNLLPGDVTIGTDGYYTDGRSIAATSDNGFIVAGSTSDPGLTHGNGDLYLLKTDGSFGVTWQNAYGGTGNDAGRSVIETVDGGYVATGTIDMGAGNIDVYLLKTTSGGDQAWARTLGGASQDTGECVIEVPGGYVLSGSTWSYGMDGETCLYKTDTSGNLLPGWPQHYGTAGAGYSVAAIADGYVVAGSGPSYNIYTDVYLLMTDLDGNKLWDRSFGGPGYDYARDIVVTADAIAMVGPSDAFDSNYDIYLVITDLNGNMPYWHQFYDAGAQDMGYSIVAVSDGYVIAGETDSFGGGDFDVYLMKTDLDGRMIWENHYGGSGHEGARSVIAASDGFVIAGYTTSYGGDFDFYLVKTDLDGNLVWQEAYGGAGSDSGFGVVAVSDGYVVAGSTDSFGGDSDVYLVKARLNGDLDWEKNIGGSGSDSGSSIVAVSDGFVICGQTNSIGSGGFDAYLVKADLAGDMVWENAFGGAGNDYVTSVVAVSDGFVMAGGTDSFGSGAGDVYLVKADADGDFVWQNTIGGPFGDGGSTIAAVSDGFLIGGYTNSFGTGDEDVYLVKADQYGDLVWQKTIGGPANDMGYGTIAVDDGYVITGITISYGSGITNDVYLVKVDKYVPPGIPALVNMFYDRVSLPEGKRSFQVSIVRSDQLATTCTVTVRAFDGSALAGQDYVAVDDVVVTFDPQETTKVVRVLIIDDRLKELNAETFTVRLTGASGAIVGIRDATTCEIRANDPLGV